MKKILIAILIFILIPMVCGAKTINPYLVRIGSTSVSGQTANLAKFDILLMQKFHYDDDAGEEATTWANIKAINPSCEIYCYQSGMTTYSTHDAWTLVNIDSLDRWDDPRDHSLGDIYNDNYGFILQDAGGMYLVTPYTDRYYLDPEETDFDDYAAEAYIHDHIGQAWEADGIFSDHIFASRHIAPLSITDDDEWNTLMNAWISSVTGQLHTAGIKFGGNRNYTNVAGGASGWVSLDSVTYPPDFVLEEAFAAVKYGDSNDVQFFPPSTWLLQIQTIAAIENSDVGLHSSTDLAISGSGTDNWGKAVTYEEALWYALGSYLMVKEVNVFFCFSSTSYNTVSERYYDEYDYLDLGDPVGNYYTKVVDGTTFYLRKFDSGYVIVNPGLDDETTIDYSDLGITETCREITHDNMDEADWDTISTSTQFATFKSHRAKILWVNAVGTHTPLPSGEQSCTEPMIVSLQASTVMNANCKYDTDNVSYAEMANTYTTGQGGKLHTKSLTLSCDTAYTYYTRCIGLSAQSDADSSSITHSFTTGGESPPDPPGGGQINVELAPGSIGLSLGGTVKTVDISP